MTRLELINGLILLRLNRIGLPPNAYELAALVSQGSKKVLDNFDPVGTVFGEFTGLAIKHDAVNLGQGFPTIGVPKFVRDAASDVCSEDSLVHQYARSEGNPNLVKGGLLVLCGIVQLILELTVVLCRSLACLLHPHASEPTTLQPTLDSITRFRSQSYLASTLLLSPPLRTQCPK